MSTGMKRDEAWYAEYAARRSRWSTKPEQAQSGEVIEYSDTPLPGLDNVEFVSTLRSAKPPTSHAKPRDLFGQCLPALLESEVLPSILAALKWHPRVAWVERMNVGGAYFPKKKEDWYTPITYVEMKRKWRYVAYGDKGMCDITGQLKDGRRLEVEAKRVGENATDDQAAFLDTVRRNGGVAFVAYSVDDVMAELA